MQNLHINYTLLYGLTFKSTYLRRVMSDRVLSDNTDSTPVRVCVRQQPIHIYTCLLPYILDSLSSCVNVHAITLAPPWLTLAQYVFCGVFLCLCFVNALYVIYIDTPNNLSGICGLYICADYLLLNVGFRCILWVVFSLARYIRVHVNQTAFEKRLAAKVTSFWRWDYDIRFI